MVEIRLETLTRNEVNVLSGHERGVSARAAFDLDKLDQGSEEIDIVIPDTLEAVTPSFVQGFFARSFATLGGKDGVARRYHFRGRPLVIDDFKVGLDRLGFDRRKIL